MLIFMVTSLETIGDITATSDVSEQPVSGPLYEAPEGRRAGQRPELDAVGGVQHLPQLLLRPEQRVIQLTGVASRYVGFVVALMLIALGLFPAVAGFVQHIPEPVLGGATIVMFGTIAASGVRIVSRERLNRRAIMIMALSLAVGMGVSQQPLILQFAPDWLKTLLSSGIAAGGITAIVLNLVFPQEYEKSNPSIDVQTAACGRFIVYQTIALEMPGQLRHKQGIFLTDADVDDEIYRKAVADVAAADRVGGGGTVPGGANSLGGRPPERLDQRQQ